METRNKRKQQLSSPKKSARVGLKFGENTSPKRQKHGHKVIPQSIEPEPESFNIKSFYGKRQKVHYPHSPGRRKAATEKVLQRLSTENERPEPKSRSCSGAVLNGGKVFGRSVPQTRKRKATFDFHSSESGDSEGHSRSILKQTNASAVIKKVPLDIRIKRKPERKVRDDAELKGAVETPGAVTQLGTPTSSGKKFFKTRSPGAANKYIENLVVKQGYVNFVSKRSQMKPKSDIKKASKSKTDKKINKVAVEDNKYATVIIDNMKGIGNKENETDPTVQHISDKITESSLGEIAMSPTGDIVNNAEGDTATYPDTHLGGDITKSHRDNISNGRDVTNSVPDINSNESDISLVDISDKGDNIDSVKGDNTDFVEGDNTDFIEGDNTNFVEGDNTDFIEGDHTDSISDSVRGEPADSISDSVRGEPADSGADDSLYGDISASSTGDESSSLDSEDSSMMSGSETETKQKLFPIFTQRRSVPTSPGRCSRASVKRSPGGSPLLKYVKSKDKMEQLVIDAGQKRYGVTQCEVCAMVYTLADPADETLHLKFHQSLLHALKFPGWKKERVVQEYPDSGARVVMIEPDDPKYALRKVEEINHIMGQELGFPELAQSFRSTNKAFLYVSEEKKIEGCCVTESVSQGYPVIPDAQEVSHVQSGQRPWYCSDEPKPANIGISRIWVHNQARKKGVATKLLDCVRQWSIYGVVIPKNKLAFSDPTPDGKIFATKYTGQTDFLVYKYH